MIVSATTYLQQNPDSGLGRVKAQCDNPFDPHWGPLSEANCLSGIQTGPDGEDVSLCPGQRQSRTILVTEEPGEVEEMCGWLDDTPIDCQCGWLGFGFQLTPREDLKGSPAGCPSCGNLLFKIGSHRVTARLFCWDGQEVDWDALFTIKTSALECPLTAVVWIGREDYETHPLYDIVASEAARTACKLANVQFVGPEGSETSTNQEVARMKASTRITEWETTDGSTFNDRLKADVWEKELSVMKAVGDDQWGVIANAATVLPALRKYVAAKARLDARGAG